jgi:hypothetical protein
MHSSQHKLSTSTNMQVGWPPKIQPTGRVCLVMAYIAFLSTFRGVVGIV